MKPVAPSPNLSPFPVAPPMLGGALDAPFATQWEWIRKSERIELTAAANFWRAQHATAKRRIADLEGELAAAKAEIQELRNRLFGKKSEKEARKPAESDSGSSGNGRGRGHQPGAPGHGRTPHAADLPVVEETLTLDPLEHLCPHCHLLPVRDPAQDEVAEFKEVEVRAFIRRIRRQAWVRGCQCEQSPTVLLPPPPPRLIPRSDYAVSFWVEVLVGKFHYGRPTHRLLRDLGDQGMPVSPGTVAGGLQRLLPLFEPLVEAFYCRQMQDSLFWCDETRWEVFVVIAGKTGHRWYLWVFRSASVVFYALEPSRSAAVPGAHFAGLQSESVIVVCDRYSAYKKLARLAGILLAFCWAHVRRDFLEAARGFAELESWALEWKERIGALYHLNQQRLEHWESALPLFEQNGAFQTAHQALAAALDGVEAEAKRLASPEPKPADKTAPARPTPARQEQRQIAQSLLDHWAGLRRFLDHPAIPMDNNGAERVLRGPVTGRKNFYGAGSLWSAELTAMLFTLFQTLDLWDIPVRPWLARYLQACAEHGGRPPTDLTPFLPWPPAATPRTDTS